jgi:hypothetical protein
MSVVLDYLSIAYITWRQIACEDNCVWLTLNTGALFQRTISYSSGTRQEIDTWCRHSAAAMCESSEAALMADND